MTATVSESPPDGGSHAMHLSRFVASSIWLVPPPDSLCVAVVWLVCGARYIVIHGQLVVRLLLTMDVGCCTARRPGRHRGSWRVRRPPPTPPLRCPAVLLTAEALPRLPEPHPR